MGELQLKNLLNSDSIKVGRLSTPHTSCQYGSLVLTIFNPTPLQSVLDEVIELHNEINDMATSMSAHRFAAARKLEEANKLNLKLIQRMLSEVLMLHRHKFQVRGGEREGGGERGRIFCD